ncbi:hypothetical protein [Kutzneria sp. 744]|uniref:hypothetical protein n=1 Tax=Kutzneria sp. (strain 744) TaxID=345341 RepID=UPI0003EEC74D|nr:hypothetical protein [Kutzneria sp. 744]EWM14424.1 hypothetical protein KUTG_04728 [Kutzneria sp. 744]
MTGPDLPAPDELFEIEMWRYRWPSGTFKAELFAGVLVYSGEFDERDVETARRTYPGRQIVLNDGGGIEVHPGGDAEPRSVFETFLEQLKRERG